MRAGRVVENAEFTAFGRRVLRAAGRRVAAGDVDALPALAALAAELDAAITDAVTGLRGRPATAGARSPPGSGSPGRPHTNAGPTPADRARRLAGSLPRRRTGGGLMTTAQLVVLALVAGVGLWVLHALGQAVTKLLEAAAAIAVVFVAVWLAVKGVWKTGRWLVRHWRTTLTTAAVAAWWHWLGWASLAITVAVRRGRLGGVAVARRGRRSSRGPAAVAAGVVAALDRLRPAHAALAARLPAHRPRPPASPVTVQVTPFRRSAVQPQVRPRRDQVPRVVGVRSGPSWDEVRVRLVPGQTPEDVRPGRPRPRRGPRGGPLPGPGARPASWCRSTSSAATGSATSSPAATSPPSPPSPGTDIDLRRVWSGRTEYGTDWHQPLAGGHTLTAGATGAGKNSVGWAPIVSIAPAIRDGLVRVSGIDPKGMELAYGRRIFHRYAVTSKDALALLDDLVDGMDARKAEFAGRVRTVPITREHPLELLEFDEIGALIRYVGDRKTREAIIDRVAAAHHPGPGAGLHGARLRAGADQGHRPGPGPVPPPHLPARRHQDATWRWCSGTRPTTAAPGPTASASPNPASATCSAKASANPCACGPAGCPTRRSRNSRPSSPAHPPRSRSRRPGAAAARNPPRATGRRCRMSHHRRPPGSAMRHRPEPAEWVDQDQLTRAQKALLALSNDVADQLAEDHGVCVRPLAMRRHRHSPPAGSTSSRCPCGSRGRTSAAPARTRPAGCGWSSAARAGTSSDEPISKPAEPTEAQKELMAARADLHAAYQRGPRRRATSEECEEIRDIVAELDERAARRSGSAAGSPRSTPNRDRAQRSTRRRQDAPNLPRRPVEDRTVGRVFGGKYRPSTFLTLTCD